MNSPQSTVTPKFQESPKILLIDMPENCEAVLKKAGYNVEKGTFGWPIAVGGYFEHLPVSTECATLPDYHEQDIVIINLVRVQPAQGPAPEIVEEQIGFWQRGPKGILNHIPLLARKLRQQSRAIVSNGGIFIVIASDWHTEKYFEGIISSNPFGVGKQLGYVGGQHQLEYSNWDFLEEFDLLEVSKKAGSQIDWVRDNSGLVKLLERAASDTRYQCTMKKRGPANERWISLASNKHGNDVAGVILGLDGKPAVLVFPEMPRLNEILVELLEDYVAEWRPNLFPDLENTKWIHAPEYEFPSIIEKTEQIAKLKRDTEKQVKDFESQIEQARKENESLYSLLTSTGTPLEWAVIHTLKKIGFKNVIHMDTEGSGDLKEDVQVREDMRPILVIDVKGVRGHPEDDESLQAEKHAAMRKIENSDANFHALTIINHQLKMPARERDKIAYRENIIRIAGEKELGLMTTWDLYNILRNMEALNWPKETVLPIFYQVGRIDPVPSHYVPIGEITRIWTPAFNLITSQPIKVGDRLAVETEETFREFEVASLQVDKVNVPDVLAGRECGVGHPEADQLFKKGARVFQIRKEAHT